MALGRDDQPSAALFPFFQDQKPELTRCYSPTVQRLLEPILKTAHGYQEPERYALFQLYCASGEIDPGFLQLLDNDTQSFDAYFKEAHQVLLEMSLSMACVMGHLPLVRYLLEVKACQLNDTHLLSAAKSGSYKLMLYFLNDCHYPMSHLLSDDSFRCALLLGGNLDLVTYLIKHHDLSLEDLEKTRLFHALLLSGDHPGLLMFITEKYKLTLAGVHLPASVVVKSGSCAMISYLIEVLHWHPCHRPGAIQGLDADNLRREMYLAGDVKIVKLLESYFDIMPTRDTLRYAALSGNVDTFKHCLCRINMKPSQLLEQSGQHPLPELPIHHQLNPLQRLAAQQRDDQHVLISNGVRSGSLSMIQFLVETCGLVITGPHYLTTALASKNMQMIDYVQQTCQLHADAWTNLDIYFMLENLNIIARYFESKPDKQDFAKKFGQLHFYFNHGLLYQLLERHHCHEAVDAISQAIVDDLARSAHPNPALFAAFTDYLTEKGASPSLIQKAKQRFEADRLMREEEKVILSHGVAGLRCKP